MLGSRIEQFSAVVLGHPQPQLTQITANEYEPGQGIGSHVGEPMRRENNHAVPVDDLILSHFFRQR